MPTLAPQALARIDDNVLGVALTALLASGFAYFSVWLLVLVSMATSSFRPIGTVTRESPCCRTFPPGH